MAYSLLASATFHQGDGCLPAAARVRQCVPFSLVFFITVRYIKSANALDTNDLNDILKAVSPLYCAMIATHSVTSDSVYPDEDPKRICYRKKYVSIIHKGVVSG
jgi:hypothetical protein